MHVCVCICVLGKCRDNVAWQWNMTCHKPSQTLSLPLITPAMHQHTLTYKHTHTHPWDNHSSGCECVLTSLLMCLWIFYPPFLWVSPKVWKRETGHLCPPSSSSSSLASSSSSSSSPAYKSWPTCPSGCCCDEWDSPGFTPFNFISLYQTHRNRPKAICRAQLSRTGEVRQLLQTWPEQNVLFRLHSFYSNTTKATFF